MGIGDFGLYYCFVLCILSIIAYGTVPWYRTAMGIHLMSFMVVVMLSFSIGIIRNLWDNPSWLPEFRFIVLAVLVPIAITWRFLVFLQGAIEHWKYKKSVKRQLANLSD